MSGEMMVMIQIVDLKLNDSKSVLQNGRSYKFYSEINDYGI